MPWPAVREPGSPTEDGHYEPHRLMILNLLHSLLPLLLDLSGVLLLLMLQLLLVLVLCWCWSCCWCQHESLARSILLIEAVLD